MKDLEQFTGLYQRSKTLRFELIPIGETLKNIERNGILEADEKLADSYKEMKKTIDEFHKAFVEKALTGAKLNGVEEFFRLYNASSEEKKTDKYKEKFKSIKDKLRKEIVVYFKAQDDFKFLDKKELIQKELEKWINANRPELYYDPDFRNFTTYFTGYNENRMNMYSEEEKASAIAHRLIDENLPRFIDNIQIYELVRQSPVSEDLPKLYKDMEPWLNVTSLDDLFILDAYSDFLTQPQIEAYNGAIGGRTEENGKIQGLNEYINLFNQQHPEKKLPKMKVLYKQILSEKVSLSWLPESFEDANELLDAVKKFYDKYTEESTPGKLKEILADLSQRDTKHIYIRNDSSVTAISNSLFGFYGVINDAVGFDLEDKKKSDYLSIADIQTALDKYIPPLDNASEELKAAYSPDCIAAYFGKNLCADNNDLLKTITETYEKVKDLLCIGHEKDFILSKEDKENLKALLDCLMELLHFIKPLYLKPDANLPRDEVFYGDFDPLYESLEKITKLYDKVRNYVTKKPYSTEKIKLNFECSTLLDGWDLNKETQNHGVILLKDGNCFLGIMDRSGNKSFADLAECEDADCYQKMVYKLLPGPNKMLPKVFFSKSRIDEFAPSAEILDIYKKGSFKKGNDFNLSDCRKLIDFFKASIEKHPEWRKFGFRFSPTEAYQDISDFYREISEQGYMLTFQNVSAAYVDELVKQGKLYLFRIYNKDFSTYSKGKPNLHTMYWKALFDEKNLSDVVYKLNGEAEVFFRKSSIKENDRIIHPASRPIEKKNPNSKGTSEFTYDLIKDRRYTVDKFMFHVPITMNFKAAGNPRINEKVCAYLKNNPDVNILGIDRGERNLLYISLIDRNGHVLKNEKGEYIQYSLNEINGSYTGKSGEPVGFKTPYHELLDKREKERKEARVNWDAIENIKELKSGYLSQVVHHITKLMVKHNAVVVMEDLNGGFKNGRKKVEKQVYQNFEKALIEKLNYLVFKDRAPEETGGLYHALQLTDEFSGFNRLTKQSGFIFYIPAWNTSKIDPVTGFVDYLKPKYKNVDDAKSFFSKFKSIRYNEGKDWFEFAFDYSDFTDKAKDTRTDWIICTHGNLRYAYNRSLNNNRGGVEKYNVTEKLKEVFTKQEINYRAGELIDEILAQNSKEFFRDLIKVLQITLALRYSCEEESKDFILSPVADKNGEFYCSEGRNDGLPQDADANGAYNIARKGLWVLKQIDKAQKYSDWSTKISNKDWLKFVQLEQ